jgi:FKBP-type peptidyl-prolyl cis-trans isomerase (trigger factor)
MDINYKIEKKDGAYITASLTIPYKEYENVYNSLLKREAEKVDIKGFRKGNVPSEIVEPQLKQMLSFEALENLAPQYVAEIIKKEEMELMAPPEYTELPDLSKKEDLSLKIKFTTIPEFKLGDMKKIKVQKQDASPKKEEIENTVNEMFEKSTLEKKGEKPNDDWAKKTAELYKLENVKDLKGLKEEVGKLLSQEKERIVRQNAEHEVMKKAIELSNIEVPKEAIEFEAREREKSFLHELKHAKMSLEDFCKNNNTKIEQLRELWEKDATEALEADALLKLYGKKNEIVVTEKELEDGIENIKKSQGKEIPEEVINDQIWRNNVRNVIIKQKAYRDLIEKVLK